MCFIKEINLNVGCIFCNVALMELQSVFHFVNVNFILEAQGESLLAQLRRYDCVGDRKGNMYNVSCYTVAFHSCSSRLFVFEFLDTLVVLFLSVRWDHNCISGTE